LTIQEAKKSPFLLALNFMILFEIKKQFSFEINIGELIPDTLGMPLIDPIE
jgi:hypothetical protein